VPSKIGTVVMGGFIPVKGLTAFGLSANARPIYLMLLGRKP
jgi:hypothetical protein